MTSDPIQRAFDGCAHEATTTQVRHTGTLQACDDCGQTWSFPATSQARGKDEIKSFVAASRDVAKAQRERDEARAERDENRASIESMHAHMDVLEAERDRARQLAADLEAENARLTRIVADAALETYTPEGAEVVAHRLVEYARRIDEADVVLARVRALADEWRDEQMPEAATAWYDLRAALNGSDQ